MFLFSLLLLHKGVDKGDENFIFFYFLDKVLFPFDVFYHNFIDKKRTL